MSFYELRNYQKKIEPAFEQLRKLGYFAEQDFMCCQSCGWASIPEEQEEKAVFYHEQDKEHLEFGSVLLAWSGNGYEIVKTLKENIEYSFVKIIWDGSDSTRIEIKF
jgi:hypothetical protein